MNEEQPRPVAEEEVTTTSNPRKSSEFINGLLKRLGQSESSESTPPQEALEAEEATRESRVDQFFRKLGEKLHMTSVDMVPEPVAVEAESTEEAAIIPDHIIDLPNLVEADEPEPATTAGEDEEVFIPLSDEAIRRYEPEEDLPKIKQEVQAGGAEETVIREKHIKEKVKVINESVDHPIMPTNTLALSTGEILRRQRERELRKEVKKIRQEVDNTEREKKAMVKQQKEFSRSLGEQAGATKKLTEQQAKPVKTEVEHWIRKGTETKPIVRTEPMALRAERESAKLKEMVTAPPPEKPEVILSTVEAAANKNVAIESLFERRHETRGSSDDITSGGGHNASNLGQPVVSKLRRSGFYQPPVSMPAPDPLQSSIPPNQSKAPSRPDENKNLYRQAALSGFWAAIIICAILLVLAIGH